MERQVQSPALVMRVMKYAFLVSMFLFIYVLYVLSKVPAPSLPPVSQPLELALTVVGLACIAMGFVLPRFLDRTVQQAPQSEPLAVQRGRWMTKGVISLACFEACTLFGFMLNRLGGRLWLVELLFGAGIVAMLFWSPEPPPRAEEQ